MTRLCTKLCSISHQLYFLLYVIVHAYMHCTHYLQIFKFIVKCFHLPRTKKIVQQVRWNCMMTAITIEVHLKWFLQILQDFCIETLLEEPKCALVLVLQVWVANRICCTEWFDYKFKRSSWCWRILNCIFMHTHTQRFLLLFQS